MAAVRRLQCPLVKNVVTATQAVGRPRRWRLQPPTWWTSGIECPNKWHTSMGAPEVLPSLTAEVPEARCRMNALENHCWLVWTQQHVIIEVVHCWTSKILSKWRMNIV